MPNELTSLAPTERTARLVALATDALAGVEIVRTTIRRSTKEALEFGRLLIEERAHVQDTLGHGAWLPYFDAHLAKAISYPRAMHWLKQAKSLTRTIPSISQSNELRNQVLTLGLFPPKQHTDTGQSGKTLTVTLPKNSTHLGIINRFSAWYAWLCAETKGEIAYSQAKQLLKDFEPIAHFIESLHQVTIEHELKRDA